MVNHRLKRPDRQLALVGPTQINQEERQPLCAFLYRLQRCRTRQQQHQIRILGPARPDLLAGNNVLVAVPLRPRLDARRVRARRRLCNAKSLQPQSTFRQRRQPPFPLLRRAVPYQRPHNIHLRVADARVPPAAVHLLQNHRSLCNRRPPAPILLRDQRRQKARLRHRLHKLNRIPPLPVQPLPIRPRKPRAQLPHTAPQLGVLSSCVDLNLGR